MLRSPSIKALTSFFNNDQDTAKKAKSILNCQSHREVWQCDHYLEYKGYYSKYKLYDLKLMAISSIHTGLFGVEIARKNDGKFICAYINSGDSYRPTIIYTGKSYILSTIGDYLERKYNVY